MLFAWRGAEIAALASALMLMIALLVRWRLRAEDRLQARVIATWRPILTRIAVGEGEPATLPAMAGRELRFLMEEWNSLHDAVRGDSGERLNALAPKLGFNVAARRGLRSGQIGERILAIRTLGHLRDGSAWKELQDQLVASNALVSFYAAAALVAIDAQRAMPGIMRELSERESWPAEAMARLLVDVGADISREPIRALMLTLAPGKLPPLLPWLAHIDAVLGSEVAIELLRRHPQEDALVAAALLVIQDPALLGEIAKFSESNDAHVRENVAQALGRLGGMGEVETLVWLMGDPVWWVRYRAAQALLRLKGMTQPQVAAIRETLGDKFARDMLDQAVAEAGA